MEKITRIVPLSYHRRLNRLVRKSKSNHGFFFLISLCNSKNDLTILDIKWQKKR
jgi:hypothetical protein